MNSGRAALPPLDAAPASQPGRALRAPAGPGAAPPPSGTPRPGPAAPWAGAPLAVRLRLVLALPAARLLLALPLLAGASLALAAPAKKAFQFSVAAQVLQGEGDEAGLRRSFEEAEQKRAAFLLVTGIKSASEACSDKLYAQRRALLDQSPRPLVLSLAGSDWTACRNSAGRSNAIERLNRIRELFFDQDESLGEKKLALNRLSNSSQFRSYAENAYWEYGNVLFATINLPARNNHFLTEAGRNSEYEDRTVANRSWLQRLFALAKRKRLDGIVLVSDGDIGAHREEGFSLLNGFSTKQDGFAQTRKQVRALADKFKGKVLLIDSAQKPAKAPASQNGAASASASATASAPDAEAVLQWRGNLAHLSLSPGWTTIRVAPASPALFTVPKAGPVSTLVPGTNRTRTRP